MTMLQEGIATLILKEIGESDKYEDINVRGEISKILQKLNNLKIEENIEKIKSELEKKILNVKKINELSKIFADISGIRNDINHAGFRPSPLDAKDFKIKLEEEFKKFKEIWENRNNVIEREI